MMLERLYRRIISMISIGKIVFSNDSGVNQIVQVKFNDQQVLDMIRVTEYGFASLPPLNSDAIAVFLGGERSSGVVIGTKYPAERFANLKQGESALYDNVGQSVYLRQDDGSADGVIITGDAVIQLKYGATGTFTTSTGAIVTVVKGLITNID